MFPTKRLVRAFAVFTIVFASVSALAQSSSDESIPFPVVAPSDSGAYHAINQLPLSLRESAPFAREFYEFARHAGSSGVVDNDAYLSAFNDARASMLRANARANSGGKSGTLATLGTWSNIGLVGADTVPSAGITFSITFDPQHSNVMYASGAGGLWRSTDTGKNWTNLTDNWLPNLIVSSVAVDPVNSNTLYLGTGDCEFGVPVYGGSGLYKSTDGGSSFIRLNTPSGAQFVKELVDPAHDSIVLASSYDAGKVFRSTDFGATWTSVFSGLTWDMIATNQNGSIAFYLLSGGVNKSTDEGKTWVKVSGSTVPASIARGALAFPANAPNKIYALVADAATQSISSLFESSDAGTTWNSISTPSPDTVIFNPYGHPQGWYDLYLGIAPNASPTSDAFDTIYVGGIQAAVKRGTDGWDIFSSTTHADGGGGYPHVDHHSFAVNPQSSRIVYDGNDGGLWVNYAVGSNSLSNGGGWQLHSLNMVTNRFYHLGLDKLHSTVTWAGAQDQGMWRITDDGNAPQQEANIPGQAGLGDAMQAIISTANSSLIFAEGPEGQIVKGNLPNVIWSTILSSGQGAAWDNPFKMSPVSHGSIPGGNILYVGESQLLQSTNGGT